MNLVEIYITKIWSEKKIQCEKFVVYEMVVDSDCYGHKEFKKHIYLSEEDWKMVKEKGYYLG